VDFGVSPACLHFADHFEDAWLLSPLHGESRVDAFGGGSLGVVIQLTLTPSMLVSTLAWYTTVFVFYLISLDGLLLLTDAMVAGVGVHQFLFHPSFGRGSCL
jgi:hypothetical protein